LFRLENFKIRAAAGAGFPARRKTAFGSH
jgi:hypothetical protein